MQNNAFWFLINEIAYYDNSKQSYTTSFIIVFLRLAASWKKVNYLNTLKMFAACCWDDPKYRQNDLFYELKLAIELILWYTEKIKE
jgi:hypothetical protein